MLKRKQKSSALLTALFVTALAAIISVSVIYKFRLMVHLAQLNNFSNQTQLYLLGINDQVEADLENYTTAWLQPNQPSPNLRMPLRIKPKRFQNVVLMAQISDEQAKFNINILHSVNNQARFIHLVQIVMPELSLRSAQQIARNISDWLSEKSNTTDQIYARRKPPYRAGHRPMIDISELLLVDGITPQIFNTIKPYISALPGDTKMNINSATPPVLATLSPNITLTKAKALYACRKTQGVFLNTDDYNKTCMVPLGLNAASEITTSSHYFLLQSLATSKEQQNRMESLLTTYTDPKIKRPTAYAVWLS